MKHLVQKLFSVWVPVILIGMTGIPAHAQHPNTVMPRGSMGILQTIEAEISDLLEHNRGCVVRIHTIYGPIEDDDHLGFGNAYTHGTGFLIDSTGHVLTVDKAVKGASEIRVTLGDGSVVEGKFVASDPTSDVAVIRVLGEHRDQVTFGNSDRVRAGHYSFILGNTFGQLLPSIGFVYEVNRAEDLIQITSSVHSSYGGAPVFNSAGHVIGMVWATPLQSQSSGMRHTSELPTSVFVIPINRAKSIAAVLIERGEMAYGWLGVEVDRETHPVVVTDVAVGGPAWKSGIRPGDQIVAYNGKRVSGPFHLERLVMETPPGIGVPIRVKRESIIVATEATVVGRQPVSRDRLAAATKMTVPVEASDEAEVQLFQQIQTLEQEIGRLRVLMEKK